MSDLANAVGNLRSAASRLNALTDDIAELVRETEDFLNVECSVGIDTNVVVESGDNEDGAWWLTLGYERFAGRFRILVHEGHDFSGEPLTETKPWVECARDVKLKTVAKLSELLVKIANSVDMRIEDAQKAKDNLQALIAKPKRGKGTA